MLSPRKRTPLRDLRTYGQSHAVRLPDYDYRREETVHLTVCADHGRPFGQPGIAAKVCASVEECCRLCEYQLFGYCLMPDHLHVLLSPARSALAVSQWLRRFKSYTTNEFVGAGGDAPLWQRLAHDHVCRDDETAEKVLTYIVNNPVRAELVRCWRDWPWTKVFIEI